MNVKDRLIKKIINSDIKQKKKHNEITNLFLNDTPQFLFQQNTSLD